MTQVTLSCRFAAIHLETPLLGFFRNYLPSRIHTLFVFFDNLKIPAPLSGNLFVTCVYFSIPASLPKYFSCVF